MNNKILLLTVSLIFNSVLTFAANRYWVAAGAGNWNDIANWSISNGGASGASVPTTGDFVWFNASGLGDCTLDIAASFDGINITGYTGIIDFGVFSFNPTVSGTASCIFQSGTINGTTALSCSTIGLINFTGTAFNVDIDITADRIGFNGGIFNSPVVVVNDNAGSYNGAGGCTFNSTFHLTNAGTGYIRMGFTSPDIFNQDITLINTSTSRIVIGYGSAGNQFNGDVTVGSTNGIVGNAGVWLGESVSSGLTLAATKKIIIDPVDGFTNGDLRLYGFTQLSTTAQNFSLTGTSRFISIGSTINGNVNIDAPRIAINTSSFSGTTDFEKTGVGSDVSTGGNTFTGNCIIKNSGASSFLFGNGSPDTFNANLTFINRGTYGMYLAYSSVGNTIAGDLILQNSGTGTSTFINAGHVVGSTISVTGNTSLINDGTSSNSLRIYFGNQAEITLNGDLTVTNNGTSNYSEVYIAHSEMSSVSVSGVTTITNLGSNINSYVFFGRYGDIVVDNDLYLTNNSNSTNSVIYCNYNPTSLNQYNGNIIVESTDAVSDGIRFGSNGGAATLLATKTVSIGGAGFIAGDLQFRNFTQIGATPQSLICTGTARIYNYNSNWSGNVNFISPQIITRGTTYNGTAYLEKSGAAGSSSAGGNTFVNNTELKNSGSGYFLMGNGVPDTFQVNLDVNNTGTSHIYIGYSSVGNVIDGDFTVNNNGSMNSDVNISYGSISSLTVNGASSITNNSSGTNSRIFLGSSGDIVFNGTLAITNNSTATNSRIYVNYSPTSLNEFNDNIIVENTLATGDGISFGANGGTSTLADTKTISIGGGGFVAGYLIFRNFTQIGATPQALTSTGTTKLVNHDSNWGGNVSFIAPRIATRGTMYNGTAFLEKTGATNDVSQGGNVFVLNCELKNSGSGYFLMGSSVSDEFQADLDINNIGTSRLLIAYNSSGNTIAGDFTANNDGTGTTYIYVCSVVGSDLTIAGSSVISNLGTGDYSRVFVGYSGSVIFNGTLDIINSSNATVSSMGFSYVATSNNIYNEDITVASTDPDTDGILFGYSGGSGTLAATKTITIGGGGFVAGDLEFRNFTQIGATSQALTCTGTARIYNFESNWGGDVTFIAPRINTRETTYNGITYLEKNGATSDASAGGNTFVLNTELKNSGSGYFLMGNSMPDAFQSNLLMNNIGTHYMYLAHNSTGNTVDGTLTINNTGNGNNNVYVCLGILSTLHVLGNTTVLNVGTGSNSSIALGFSGDIIFDGTLSLANNSGIINSNIYCNYYTDSENLYNGDIILESTDIVARSVLFGGGNGVGTLAATKTVSIGGAGFIGKEIQFRNFTQIGATPQVLTCGGTTRIYNYDSNWGGAVTFIAPRINTRGTVYDGDTYLEKTGGTNDASVGGNTFNTNVTFKNSGTAYLMPSNSVTNDFNGNATYIKTNSGLLYPGYNCNNTYAGNLTIDANSVIRFGAAINGRTIFDGTTAQSINTVGATPTPEFRDVQTINSTNEITLNTPIVIRSELDLDQGNLISSTANLVYMNDNSIVSSVSDDAFVDGPLEKIGNEAFVFPVGDAGVYQPIAITAPSSGSARFKGEYFNMDVAAFYDDNLRDPEIDHVSDCEYWILDRTASVNNVSVTLGFKPHTGACSGVLEPFSLVVARWNGSLWKNEGNGGTTGTFSAGTIITADPITSFSPFILATLTDANPLPIELTDFQATLQNSHVDLLWQTASERNNDYFTLEKSKDGYTFVPFDKVSGAGNSSSLLNYSTIDANPYLGISYYRLKQTDFDGKYTYSNIVTINNLEEPKISVYPNPINDVLNIVNTNLDATIKVYSVAGGLIYSGNEISINATEWAKGIYQLLVIDAKGVVIESIRVVK